MNLKTLSLRAMKDTFSKDVDILMEGLKQVPLEEFDIAGNPLGDEFVAELGKARGSPFLRSVRRFDLKFTNLTFNGLKEFLSLELKLETLRVSQNKLGDEGMMALAAATSIEAIYACNTGLTEGCYGQLAIALAANPMIKIVKFLKGKRLNLHEFRQGSSLTPKMVCPNGDQMVRGAPTPLTRCGACLKANIAIYACPKCGYFRCQLCCNNSTFAADLGLPKLADARMCSDDFSSMVVLHVCAALDYKYVEFNDKPMLPLVGALQLQEVDLRTRRCLASMASLTLSLQMADCLRRIYATYEYNRNGGIDMDCLLMAMINRPNLKDVTLVNPPFSAALRGFLTHGQKLERLTLDWPHSHEVADLESILILIGRYCVSLKYLKIKGMHFSAPANPYTGQADHPFHCFTFPSEVRVASASMSRAARAPLVQALACNKGLQRLTLGLDFEASLSEVDTAVSLQQMFQNCQQLKYVRFRRMFNPPFEDQPLGFYEKFAELVVPALIAHPALKTLCFHPNSNVVADAMKGLVNKSGMFDLVVKERYATLPALVDLVVTLAPKFSGLVIREDQFSAEELCRTLRALLDSGKPECKEREGPLKKLGIGRGETTPEILTLCVDVIQNRVLAVSDLCIHGLEYTPELYAALKQAPHITNLDVSGSTRLDFNALVDTVTQMPNLICLNINDRSPAPSFFLLLL